jgi:hypothetical protein
MRVIMYCKECELPLALYLIVVVSFISSYQSKLCVYSLNTWQYCTVLVTIHGIYFGDWIYRWHCPHRKYRLLQFLCYFVAIRYRGNVFTVPLSSNGCLFWVCYSGFYPSCRNITETKMATCCEVKQCAVPRCLRQI